MFNFAQNEKYIFEPDSIPTNKYIPTGIIPIGEIRLFWVQNVMWKIDHHWTFSIHGSTSNPCSRFRRYSSLSDSTGNCLHNCWYVYKSIMHSFATFFGNAANRSNFLLCLNLFGRLLDISLFPTFTRRMIPNHHMCIVI